MADPGRRHEAMPPNIDGAPLTESEYRAWVGRRMPEIAGELTERYRDVLPEGARFEWAAGERKGGGHGHGS